MISVERIDQVRREIASARKHGAELAVVPTMGALHAGHLSLIQTACEQSGFVVVTIFVNPAQFGPSEDFSRYPRPLESDLAACKQAGVDLVFHPQTELIYPPGFASFVDVGRLSNILEGKHRPGHFRGVATVVLKLLNIIQPDVAYFGRKDYQQQVLIRKMCADLELPVEIRTCPTVREADGLALSSRNRYLDAEQRESALALSQSLRLAKDRLLAGETDVDAVRNAMRAYLNSTARLQVDYATIADAETLEELAEPIPKMVALVAARVDDVRLIDNIPIRLSGN